MDTPPPATAARENTKIDKMTKEAPRRKGKVIEKSLSQRVDTIQERMRESDVAKPFATLSAYLTTNATIYTTKDKY